MSTMLCRALRSLPRGNSHRNIHTRTMQHVDINLAMRHYNHQVQVALDGTDAKHLADWSKRVTCYSFCATRLRILTPR